jgi:hypothetical protein
MGDLNAKVGIENEGLEHVLGRHGTNGINENGKMFIDFCESQEPTIGGTLFIHKEIHKNTWVSPDLRTENQIDHIATSQSFRKSLLDVCTKRGTDIDSDHHLVVASFQIKIIANKKKHDVMRKRLDVKKLENSQLKQEYKMELRNRFEALNHSDDEDVEEIWSKIKGIYVETGENILGFREIQKKDWMSEETWTKIQERKNIKMTLNSSKTRSKKLKLQEYRVANTEVKKNIGRDKRKWVSEQANKAEEAVREGDIRDLYNITRKLSKRKYQGMQPIKNKHGALLTNEKMARVLYRDFKFNSNRSDTYAYINTIIITNR